MSKNSATVIKDGQLAVATVPQTGTLVGAASEIDATALVETADGLQLCVKTCEVGGGSGGGGGTVDQTYDPTSTNAQSGTAVAEAVAPALQNKATGSRSLSILGSSLSSADAIAIGQRAESSTYGTQVAKGTAGYAGVSVGFQSISGQISVSIGANATTTNAAGAIAIGGATVNQTNNTQATATRAIAIGSYGYDNTLKVQATAQDAIQLGVGTNATAKTLQVFSYMLLDGTTGLISPERLGTGYDATKTQVLKHVNGVLTWVDEA